MSKAIEVQAPNVCENEKGLVNVFLGGSIGGNDENNLAEEWQKKVISELSDKPITFLNPRRDDWDSSWEQTIKNDEFTGQVIWELSSMEMSNIIIMYFDPNTKSPISLMELGLHANTDKLVVLCPDGFWRKGNVDVVCAYYDIDQVDSFDELIEYVSKKVNELCQN